MTSQVATDVAGFTEAEAAAARARGEGNTAVVNSSRSYGAILRKNLFTLFNNLLFGIGVALLLLNRTNDAVISVGLGLINAVISSIQEIRAKRKLDGLRLLHRGHAVVKRAGDVLLSGSSCLAGGGRQRAESVGAASHAQSVTAVARGWTTELTPLQHRIDQIVRAVMLTVALLSAAILAHAALKGLPVITMVQDAAVLSGLIPYGLFLLVAVAYTTGAAAVARRGALVQQVNAVEALSNVDVLCRDELRPHVTEVLRDLRTGGVEVKVVSGDQRVLGLPAPTPDPSFPTAR